MRSLGIASGRLADCRCALDRTNHLRGNKIEETFSPDALALIAAWIVERAKATAP